MKHEPGGDLPVFTGAFIPDPHTPDVPVAVQILDTVAEIDGEAVLPPDEIEEMPGQGAIVHIRTGQHARGGNILAWITAFHDQRDPLLNVLPVIRVFHSAIAVMGGERGEAPLKKGDILPSAHKTEVGYGMNEGSRVGDRARLHQIGPELAGEIELGVDLQGLGNVHASVRVLGSVVQLTERGVAGAGVVPRVRAFLGLAAQHFVDLDVQPRIELLQDDGQGRAHDASADQDDIRMVEPGHRAVS
jgi:hypothetical protein